MNEDSYKLWHTVNTTNIYKNVLGSGAQLQKTLTEKLGHEAFDFSVWHSAPLVPSEIVPHVYTKRLSPLVWFVFSLIGSPLSSLQLVSFTRLFAVFGQNASCSASEILSISEMFWGNGSFPFTHSDHLLQFCSGEEAGVNERLCLLSSSASLLLSRCLRRVASSLLDL